jgi:hypothetical protein
MPMCAQVHDVAADQERLVERLSHLPGDACGLLHLGRVGRQDAELVTAEARDGVGFAQRGAEPLGDRPQDSVGLLPPQHVVDLPELREVDDEHGAGLVGALR